MLINDALHAFITINKKQVFIFFTEQNELQLTKLSLYVNNVVELFNKMEKTMQEFCVFHGNALNYQVCRRKKNFF